MKEVIIDILKKETKFMKVDLTAEMLNKLIKFNSYMQEENKKYNLTAITEAKEVAIRHFLDSFHLAELNSFIKADNIIDIGSGAGFPGIPLAIAYEEKEFLLVDSLKKRIDFLQELVDRLNLCNVKLKHQRAEEIAKEKKHREKYDFVTARAVASLNVLAEYCLPLTKIEGVFVAMKYKDSNQEIEQSKNAIKTLGGKIVNLIDYSLEEGDFRLIEIKKIKSTPKKYPRRPGIPNKRPLS